MNQTQAAAPQPQQPKKSGGGKLFIYLGLGCLVVVILGIGGCAGGAYYFYSKLVDGFKEGSVGKAALEKIEANPTLKEKLGSNLEYNSISSVKVNSVNGVSTWEAVGTVKGSTGKEGTVTVRGIDAITGQVDFTDLTVYVDGTLVDVLEDEMKNQGNNL